MTQDYILIIASSGRMLAQAAKNAGLKPLVIDMFADLDTRIYALDFKQIPVLSPNHLAPAVDYFIHHYAVTQCIYGSGFEQHPDSLRYLQTRLTLSGNSAETFMRVQNKVDFFATLDKFDIPHPETVFTPPHETQNWLIKPMQGQGGVDIQRYQVNHKTGAVAYWQKYQTGSAHSVLFLANGQQCQVIGFNRQWTTCLNETDEFIFAGIINYSELSETSQVRIMDWLAKLVPVFNLTGLNSLDFIQHNAQSYVLEINPRPSASMQLYQQNLLLKHIHAKTIDMAKQTKLLPPLIYTGYQIIYAPQDVRIPENHIWENNSLDIPAAGQICRTGQPICSIIAHKKQARTVLRALNIQQQTILKGLYSHGIQS